MFSFCKPVSSRKRFLPHREINEEFSFTLFAYAEEINISDWEQITHKKSVFLEQPYLQLLEKCEHTRLNCRYVIVYHDKKPCGIIYYQIVDFKAGVFGELLSKQVDSLRSKRMNLFERYLDSNKEEVLLRLFTCGNNLVSGEYGFMFDKRTTKETANELVLKITDIVSREEKLRGTISAVLLKDFRKPLRPARLTETEGFTGFLVEPNLVVGLPAGLSSLADYTALFSKKYRNRARAIFKSMEGLSTRYLEATEIAAREKEMYALYESIFERAKFRLMKLPVCYFSGVKKLYKEQFVVKGFFKGDEMMAFATCFVMPGRSLEAHYIGFSYEHNITHDLYQNILYAMIAEGIAHHCTEVNLGRTAAEIKTTVGAVPQDLICYIKPQNTISRIIQKPFISFLQPAPLTARNPFKEAKGTEEVAKEEH